MERFRFEAVYQPRLLARLRVSLERAPVNGEPRRAQAELRALNGLLP
jgi:hypothetical protein